MRPARAGDSPTRRSETRRHRAAGCALRRRSTRAAPRPPARAGEQAQEIPRGHAEDLGCEVLVADAERAVFPGEAIARRAGQNTCSTTVPASARVSQRGPRPRWHPDPSACGLDDALRDTSKGLFPVTFAAGGARPVSDTAFAASTGACPHRTARACASRARRPCGCTAGTPGGAHRVGTRSGAPTRARSPRECRSAPRRRGSISALPAHAQLLAPDGCKICIGERAAVHTPRAEGDRGVSAWSAAGEGCHQLEMRSLGEGVEGQELRKRKGGRERREVAREAFGAAAHDAQVRGGERA